MIESVKNESELLYSKSKVLFQEAMDAFKSGEISSKSDIVVELFQIYQDYFDLMSEPQFQRVEVIEGTPLFSEDYNQMMREIYEDFTIIYREMKIITNVLQIDYNQHIVETDMIKEIAKETLDRLKDLEIYNTVQDNKNKYFARDHFLNSDKVDYDMITGKPLLIDNGNLTLPIKNLVNVAEDASVKIALGGRSKENLAIGSESNGFPGNNTEVISTRSSSLTERSYDTTFVGLSDTKANYSVILKEDDNWFEYEKVELRERDLRKRIENLGTKYDVEGDHKIDWMSGPDNGRLKLNIQIALKKEELINNIDISLYTPPQIDAQPAKVKNIIIHNEDGESISVVQYKEENQTNYFFPPTRAKIINIYFEQENYYYANIGHIYYQEKLIANNYAKYALEETKKINHATHKRVAGPNIKISDLGAQVKKVNDFVELDYPYLSTQSKRNSTSMGDRLQRMANEIQENNVEMGVEMLDAKRWAIGIRNIKINKVEYEDYGELITKPFYFDTPLEKISLNIEEGLSEVPDWFEYYVTVDDGVSWHPIAPIEHYGTGYPKIYTIRRASENSIDDEWGYIETEHEVYSIRFKIIGRKDLIQTQNTRSQDIEYDETPILHSFKLNASLFNERELLDDSYVSIDKEAIERVEDEEGEEWIKSTDFVTLNKKCIEEWIAEPMYSITGTVHMKNPIERIEFYENNVLVETKYLFSNSSIIFEHDYKFELDKSLYPLTSLQSHIPPYVKVYDTSGRMIENHHRLKFEICEPNPISPPGLGAYIQDKRDYCLLDDVIVTGIGYSKDIPLDRIELYLNGELVASKKHEGQSSNIWISYIHEEKIDPRKQYYFKLVVYDENGSTAIDRFNPKMIDCDTIGGKLLGDTIRIVGDKFCQCDDLVISGEIETRSAVKEVEYYINGKLYNPNNFESPKSNNPCRKVSNGKPQKVPVFSDDISPQDTYESAVDLVVPGWVLNELGVIVGKINDLQVVVTEQNGQVTKKKMKFDLIDCPMRECVEINQVKVTVYDHKSKKPIELRYGGNSLPVTIEADKISNLLHMGWHKDKGIYFRQPIEPRGPGVTILDLSIIYTDLKGESHEVKPSRRKEREGIIYGEDTLLDEVSVNEKVNKIQKGLYEDTLILKKKDSVIVYGFDDLEDKEICIKGNLPEDYNNIPNMDSGKCDRGEYLFIQMYDPINKKILNFTTSVYDPDIIKYPLSIGSAELYFGFSNKSQSIGFRVTGTDIEKEKIYIIGVKMFSTNSYKNYHEHRFKYMHEAIGGVSNSKVLAQRDVNFLTDIPYVKGNGELKGSGETWVAGRGTFVNFKKDNEMTQTIISCENDSEFDGIIEDNGFADEIFEIIPDLTDDFCLYLHPKEVEDPHYTPTDEDLVGTNILGSDDHYELKYVVRGIRGVEEAHYKIYQNGNVVAQDSIKGYGKEELPVTVFISGKEFRLGQPAKIVFDAVESNTGKIITHERDLNFKNCVDFTAIIKEDKSSDIYEGDQMCWRYIPENLNFSVLVEHGAGIRHISVLDQNNNEVVNKKFNDAKKYIVDIPVNGKEIRNHEYTFIVTSSSGSMETKVFNFKIVDCQEVQPGGPDIPEGVPGQEGDSICKIPGRVRQSGRGYGAQKIVYKISQGRFRFEVEMNAHSWEDSFDAYYKGELIASSNGYFTETKNFEFSVDVPEGEVEELVIIIMGGRESSSWYYYIECLVD